MDRSQSWLEKSIPIIGTDVCQSELNYALDSCQFSLKRLLQTGNTTSFFSTTPCATISFCLHNTDSIQPGPPHHPIFGHLISMGKVVRSLPNRVHPHVYPHFLTKEYNLPPVFYLDVYPVNTPMLIVIDP